MIRYLLLLFLLTSNIFSQPSHINSNNFNTTRLLNNIEILQEHNSEDLSLRIFGLTDESGSAGFENGESLTYLFFAISEIDEFPNQTLFQVSPSYNPTINKITEDNGSFIINLTFGKANNIIEAKLEVSLEKCNWVNHKKVNQLEISDIKKLDSISDMSSRSLLLSIHNECMETDGIMGLIYCKTMFWALMLNPNTFYQEYSADTICYNRFLDCIEFNVFTNFNDTSTSYLYTLKETSIDRLLNQTLLIDSKYLTLHHKLIDILKNVKPRFID